MARIVLASGSPRRQELLRRIGLTDFTVRVPQVEEYYPASLSPEEIVTYISREKSLAVPSDEDEIVITADTMVFLGCERLGKPRDAAQALEMLSALQGREHTVCTGVTVRQGQRILSRACSTRVFFRQASEDELRAYIAGGEPMDKAGAYGVQGQGALLVDRIEGDFFNVMGLPVTLLEQMLKAFGVCLLG
jgi:septum formation protein